MLGVHDNYACFFSSCSCVFLIPIASFKLKRENELFFLSVELYDQIVDVCLYPHTAFPPFLSFYSMHQ